MKKLIEKIGIDKVYHAGGLFLLTMAIGLGSPDIVFGIKSILIAAGIAAIVSIGKEVADYFGKGTPDVWDLVADAVGIAAAVALLSVL